jgi:hypothetical protein
VARDFEVGGRGEVACVGAAAVPRLHLRVFARAATCMDSETQLASCSFRAGLDRRPPGIEVPPCAHETGFLRIQVVVDGATASSLRRVRDADAKPVQDACHRSVGIGRERGLHAAFQHQHAPLMPRGRTRLGCHRAGRNLLLNGAPRDFGPWKNKGLRPPRPRVAQARLANVIGFALQFIWII